MLDLIRTTPPVEERDGILHVAHLPTMPHPVIAPRDALEGRLAHARPRLVRLAHAIGIPPDAAEDVVQDALIAAWRNHDRLRQPAQFDSWLSGIVRNKARLYLRTHTPARNHPHNSSHAPPLHLDPDDEAVPDPAAPDPLDALAQHDVESLVDRALGHLAPPARAALEMRYLSGMPENEAAAALSVSVPVLEARLHRARRQVQGVLAGPLRAEAEAAGLSLDGVPPAGWQETRLWCNLCGRRRLVGTFQARPEGRRILRLRCPDCSSRYGVDIYGSKSILLLDNPRSFRPALTRTMRVLAERTRHGLESGADVCPTCGSPIALRVAPPEEAPVAPSLRQHWVVAECPNPSCASHKGCNSWTAVEPALWLHPLAARFMADHPRWVTRPEDTVDYEGQPAIRFTLADAAGSARLTAVADPRTLRILTASST